MKNKELALKISKHPLMEKVAKLEDKRVVARLVVEELLRESNEDLKNLRDTLQNLTIQNGKPVYKIYNIEKQEIGTTANMYVKNVKGSSNAYVPSITIDLGDSKYYIEQGILEGLIKQIQAGTEIIPIKIKKIQEVEFQKNDIVGRDLQIIFGKVKQISKEQQTLNNIIKTMKQAKMFFTINGEEIVDFKNITVVKDKEGVFYQIKSENFEDIKLNPKGGGLEQFLKDWPESQGIEKERREDSSGKKEYDIAILNNYTRFSNIVIDDEKILVHQEIAGEKEDDDATEIIATPEEQQQVEQFVIKVEDSLKDFLNYLVDKITGGAEVPGEEEPIEEGLFDNIKKGLERSPGKAKETFFKLLSKYLKDANVGIDLSAEDIQKNWDEWSRQPKKAEEASKIIAAYTYHFKTFWKKPELTGKLIQKAAEEIVVGGKSKLDQFIEQIVGIAVEQFKEDLGGEEGAKEDFLNTSFEEDPAEYPYNQMIQKALEKKLGNNNQETINKLMDNKKFTDPAYELLEEKLKELHAEMFFEPDENILEQIAGKLNIEEYSVNGIKNSLDGFKENDLYINNEQIKKHVDYLLEEDKRIVDFIYKYITYPNTREDFKSLKPALKKLAAFLKKSEDYSLRESLKKLSDRFNGNFDNLINNIVDSNIGYDTNDIDQLNKFFKFKNNLDYFIDYFFGDDELEEPEENKDENYTYSYLVLIALNNQTKKREAELKSYFSALKKRVDKLTKDNEKPQAQKYANLKKESVFLISKLKAYNSIIKSYMDYKKDRKPGSDITDNILVEFGNEFPDSDEVFKLIRWTDKSENLIQYEDKTIPASEVYLKDIEKWEELSGPEKAKAFLYDYRTLIRDKEDGEIKRFIDRVNRIDDQIRSGKEPAPRDEKADDAIPKERYEYFLQETKPIAKFLQETPITFGDNQINFGDDKLLPEFNSDQGNLKDLVIQINRNEFNKTKLFKYIGSPQDPDEAKNRILKTIETLKAFQQAKNDGLADDEVTYGAFLEEIKDNLTYFKMGWPLFQSTGRGLKLNTPYADNKKIEKMFLIEELTDELVRMANMGGKQVKAAIKSKYSGKDDEQKGLIEKLNELTKERNFEIARDCANVYKEQGMSGPSYNQARVPQDRLSPTDRLKEKSWNKIKKLIDDIIKPFYSNHIDAALPDIENKDRYKKFLEAYKEIVQIAKDDGQELDVIDNKKPQDQRKFEFQEQLTKLIKPLIREKLKRKQNGKKNLRN